LIVIDCDCRQTSTRGRTEQRDARAGTNVRRRTYERTDGATNGRRDGFDVADARTSGGTMDADDAESARREPTIDADDRLWTLVVSTKRVDGLVVVRGARERRDAAGKGGGSDRTGVRAGVGRVGERGAGKIARRERERGKRGGDRVVRAGYTGVFVRDAVGEGFCVCEVGVGAR